MEGSAYMTAGEVADLLRIKLGTLYNWRYLGQGPKSYRVGGALRYRREEVEAWVESQSQRGAA